MLDTPPPETMEELRRKMFALNKIQPDSKLSLLCIGAHADDIEIGVGATILSMLEKEISLNVHWVVLSAEDERREEAQTSAELMLANTQDAKIDIRDFKGSYFPYQGEALKQYFDSFGKGINPDIIFTHRKNDAHQDHRVVSQLTWNTFRNHTILEYEIPKWDGDIQQTNFYSEVTRAAFQRKLEILNCSFHTQSSKDWFDDETFTGLARLRGVECRANEGLAEAFVARKLLLM